MNIRKTIDYTEMYTALDNVMAAAMPQMELCWEIGRVVGLRPEKGAAVAAAEYLSAGYPEQAGFSPRNVRRMRDLYRLYENAPELLDLAMRLGWIQNVVILEADLNMEEREWYLRAAEHFGWTKTALIQQIRLAAHLTVVLDSGDPPCYNGANEKTTENLHEEDTVCVPWEYMQKPDGRVYNEGSGEESWTGEGTPYRIGSHQHRGDWKPGLSSSTETPERAWDLLPGQDRAAAQERRLRGVRPADRDGQGQSPRYAPHLRRRFCRQDTPPDGVHRPPWRSSRPVVHRGLRGHLVGCAGWMPGITRTVGARRKELWREN